MPPVTFVASSVVREEGRRVPHRGKVVGALGRGRVGTLCAFNVRVCEKSLMKNDKGE